MRERIMSYGLVPPAFPPHSKRAKEAAEGGAEHAEAALRVWYAVAKELREVVATCIYENLFEAPVMSNMDTAAVSGQQSSILIV